MSKPSMKRVALNILALSCLLCFFSGSLLGQPRIEFEETTHNWGRIKHRENKTHTFHFRNVGDEALEIKKVEVTCGCTAALLSDSLFQPGEKGEIKVTFNSTGRVGDQSKPIYVYTNDPDHVAVELMIEAEVYLIIGVSPRSLNMGDVPKGESKTMSVTLTAYGVEEFEILSLESPGEYFVARVLGAVHSWKKLFNDLRKRIAFKFGEERTRIARDSDAPVPKEYRPSPDDTRNSRIIYVTLMPAAPLGQHLGKLKIQTDAEEQGLVEVTVLANVVGNLKVLPKHYNFGSIRRGEKRETVYKIKSRTNAPFRVTGVKTSSEYADAQLVEVSPGTEYDIELSMSPEAPIGQLQGTVTVSTTDKDEPEIELRFYARVTE